MVFGRMLRATFRARRFARSSLGNGSSKALFLVFSRMTTWRHYFAVKYGLLQNMIYCKIWRLDPVVLLFHGNALFLQLFQQI